MAEDSLTLELEFQDPSVCDLVYAMLCGEGPAFRKDARPALRALFDQMEDTPSPDRIRRTGERALCAEWDMFLGEHEYARAMCHACGAAGATVWAHYTNEYDMDVAARVWALDNGQLRNAFPLPSDTHASHARFQRMTPFDMIAALRADDRS